METIASAMWCSHANLHATEGIDESAVRELKENFVFHWGQQVCLVHTGNKLTKKQVPRNRFSPSAAMD